MKKILISLLLVCSVFSSFPFVCVSADNSVVSVVSDWTGEAISLFADMACNSLRPFWDLYSNWASYSQMERNRITHNMLVKWRSVLRQYPNMTKEQWLRFADIAISNPDAFYSVIPDIDGDTIDKLVTLYTNCQWNSNMTLNEWADTLFSDDFDDSEQISIDDFKDLVVEQNKTINPKNKSMYKYSWRQLSPKVEDNLNVSNFARLVVIDNECVDGSDIYEDGFYLQAYLLRNGKMYYQPFFFRIYATWEVQPMTDSVGTTALKIMADSYYYETLNGVSIDVNEGVCLYVKNGSYNGSSPQCPSLSFNLGFLSSDYFMEIWMYKNFGDALVSSFGGSSMLGVTNFSKICQNGSGQYGTALMKEKGLNFLCSNNVLDTIPYRAGGSHLFSKSSDTSINWYNTDKSIRYHDYGDSTNPNADVALCDENRTCDIGFFVSSEPFSQTYSIDTSRIPSDSDLVISLPVGSSGGSNSSSIVGDTTTNNLYDYRITNTTTGDTNTIYEYVTNNYTFVTNNGNNSGSGDNNSLPVGGSGNLGFADVNVGGTVNVSGGVNIGGKVDINVNVSGLNGSSNSHKSYDMPDLDPIEQYLDSAYSDTEGVRGFLTRFFGFLPSEIVGLICILISVVILARIFGR